MLTIAAHLATLIVGIVLGAGGLCLWTVCWTHQRPVTGWRNMMSDYPKWTKGPWVRDDNDGYSINRIYADARGHYAIAEVIGDDAETEANANLIAAAPDLHDAVSALASHPAHADTAMGRRAVEALAKAHGGNWSPVDGGTQDTEYVRADLLEASAAMASRQNAMIDTLRDELAKEKAKSAGLVEALAEIERKDDAGGYLYHRPGPFALIARAAIATYEAPQ